MDKNAADGELWTKDCEHGQLKRSCPLCEKAERADNLLAQKHTGSRISAHGVLGRIRDGRYYKGLNFGCGEMLRHLEEMAERFYSGDAKAVDEFLQLYDLDAQRPAGTKS